MGAQKLHVAVVGATGAVGREMVSVLEERAFPVDKLTLLASERSAGTTVEYAGSEVEVKKLGPDSFAGVDVALFSAGGAISKEYGPIAAESGAIVIDNSSAWRMEKGVPLVVPEVNGNEVRALLTEIGPKRGAIIANPNCSTIQLVVVLKPISDAVGLKRVVVSTYQSVSGAGQKGIEELSSQVRELFSQREVNTKHFPHQIAFNCIPHIDIFMDNGYTREEVKIIQESRKILGLPALRITSTAVRVPTFACHGESVNIETEKPFSPEQAMELLRSSPGVLVEDEPGAHEYPMGIRSAGTDATFVGRIRRDESVDNGLNMWVVADNLRKGAALNAVQIAEIVLGTRSVH